jgi:hypothetical protein
MTKTIATIIGIAIAIIVLMVLISKVITTLYG